MNIARFLETTARSFGHRPAVSLGASTCWSYAQLATRVAQLAAALRREVERAGDRVAIAMQNCPAYFEVLYAIWHAGLCAVPLNSKLHPRELLYAIENSRSSICFTTPEVAATLAPLCTASAAAPRVLNVDEPEYEALFQNPPLDLQEVESEQSAWLFYTSGTTGRPKGAVLTHRALQAMMWRYYADIDNLTDADCILHAAPLSHGTGLYALPHIAKGSNQIIPASGSVDPAEIFELTRHYENITLFSVPTILNRIVNHPDIERARLTAIKTMFYGGSPMYVEDLKRALATLGPRLLQIYGQGEMPNTISCLSKRMHADVGDPHYEERLSSVGIARTGVEIRIVDEQGAEVPAGTVGEVTARSDVSMSGYWDNPEASAQALRNGWLFTGDLGVLTPDGFLTLKDRSKDLIKSGGSNIYPREVEDVLLLHPDVREVAVIGRPHHDWGEEVVAFIVTRSGAQLDTTELERLCLDNIARYKRPKIYQFVTELPKSSYGKILKSELRKHIGSG
jgi:long-chain acyl-CoA synthetase